MSGAVTSASSRAPAGRRLAGALAGLGLSVLLAFVLYGSSLWQGWWCCDDAAILLHARNFRPWEYFVDADAYQALLPYSLQPLLTLSYAVDLALFGLQPSAFFAHQLVAMALCGWLLQRITAVWLDDGRAAAPHAAPYAATLLFLAGSPAALTSLQLMTRHYLEGLVCFLLGLWLVLLRLRGGRAWLLWPATAAFALAVSAKEFFVPLGLVPLFLPVGGWRQRLRAAWPWLLVLALYVGWRRYMLRDFLGGYIPGGTLRMITPQALAQAVADGARLLWPWPVPSALALAALAWLALAALRRQGRAPGWRAMLWLLPVLSLLAGPLLPLVVWPGFRAGGERYLLPTWALLCVLVAWALGQAGAQDRAWRRWLAGLLVLALAVSAGWHAHRARQSQAPWLGMTRIVGQFLLEGDARDAAFVPVDMPGWLARGMIALRADAAGRPPAQPYLDPGIAAAGPGAPLRPLPLADESDLAHLPVLPRRVYTYDAQARAMREQPGRGAELLAPWRRSLSADRLQVDVTFQSARRTLALRLDGPTGAAYHLLSAGATVPVPTVFDLRMDRAPLGCFRVRADLAGGRRIYSPLLRLAPAGEGGDQAARWQGPGDLFDPARPHADHDPQCLSAAMAATAGAVP